MSILYRLKMTDNTKQRDRHADLTKCEEKKLANKNLLREITTKGRKIMPINIIKYAGSIHPPNGSHRWRVHFRGINKHIGSSSHSSRGDAEDHLKYMNRLHSLRVRNVVYEYEKEFYCALTKGQIMKFAFHHLYIVEQYPWAAWYNVCSDSYYAATRPPGEDVLMFHSLACPGSNGRALSVDHINRNTLDDLPSNLRLASGSVQAINRKMTSRNTSGVKGVHYDKHNRKYVASWSEDKKRRFEYFPIKLVGKDKAFSDAVAFREHKENTIHEYQEALRIVR